MKIELEIWSAVQFRAFAAFCEAQAAAQDNEVAGAACALTPLGEKLAAEAQAVEPEEAPKRRGRPRKLFASGGITKRRLAGRAK